MHNDSVMEVNAEKWSINRNTSHPEPKISNDLILHTLKKLKHELLAKCKVLKTQRLIIERTERDVSNLIQRKWKLERQITEIEYITPQPTPRRNKKEFTLADIVEVTKAGKLFELIKSEGL